MADTSIDMQELLASAENAAAFLKALANPNRLVILCQLTEGERSVGELEALLGVRQPSLSQQLARLRSEGLVTTRRDAKRIYYSLASKETEVLIATLYRLFCEPGAAKTAAPAAAAEVGD